MGCQEHRAGVAPGPEGQPRQGGTGAQEVRTQAEAEMLGHRAQ